jgi:hypothetical protein
MPIHNAGYRAWDGTRTTGLTRWMTIATTGVARALKSSWLKRILFFAILPIMGIGGLFFLFEQAAQDQRAWVTFANLANDAPFMQDLSRNIEFTNARPSAEEIRQVRHEVWSYLLLTYFRYPQALLMILVVAIVCPPLISQDLRTRAYLIYFSRPIRRAEYIGGKFAIVAFFLFMITTLPALLLYCVGVLLSPSLSVVLETWDLPLRILVASILLIVPTTLVALAFSSLTLASRYAAFAWIAMWFIGFVAYGILMAQSSFNLQNNGNFNGSVPAAGWRVFASPNKVLGVVESWIFGFDTEPGYFLPCIILLAVVSLVALVTLFRRVAAPLNV